jgi:hypothetical protein
MNNNIVRIGLAAGVVVIAIVAINLLPSSLQPDSTPNGSPSIEATTAEPNPAGGLPEGSSYLLSDARDNDQGVPMTVTIPAPGWFGSAWRSILAKNDDPDPPGGAGMVAFLHKHQVFVFGDACKWSTTRPGAPATTADGTVAALAAQTSRDASAPVDIVVDGYSGKAITLRVPDGLDIDQCDRHEYGSWSGFGEYPEPRAQASDQIDEVWILDVGGHVVIIDWAYYLATPQADVDELRAIVESTTFE